MGANGIDDNDWDELTPKQQEAASKLGYNQKIWDDDDEPKLAGLEWSELTGDQQRAAAALGYSEETWDHDDDLSSTALCSSLSSAGVHANHDEGIDAGEKLAA